ncbi:PEP-CTERM sorting domain-containing protein [Gemmatimonas sp.]|uniref:PEP-CTERM sorting domain-containing protein n=1 Tax=Gemmatimonas sp. TaxID=1962908 RepID=UPI0035613481
MSASSGSSSSQYTANIGALNVTSGSSYIALFSTFGESGSGSYSFEANTADPDSGGSFFFKGAGPTSAGSYMSMDQYDLRFDANFTPVPEPSTVVLTSFGLLGVLGAGFRRCRTQSTK